MLMDLLRVGHFVVRIVSYLLDFGLSLRWVNECWTMAMEGAALVENRAGITFGVELYSNAVFDCRPPLLPVSLDLSGTGLLSSLHSAVSAMGLWRPPSTQGIHGPLPSSSCNVQCSDMTCGHWNCGYFATCLDL